MHEDRATFFESSLYEVSCIHEVAPEIFPGHVHHLKYFVFEVVRMRRTHASKCLQNMCDSLGLETE